MISVADAVALVLAKVPASGSETVAADAASGRVLAQTVVAERDQPPFDRVTMDGAAISLDNDDRRRRIVATQLAGETAQTLSDAGGAIEIMTGAALPAGADTIVPVERYRLDDGALTLERGYQPELGQFIHRRGSDHRQGDVLLRPGVRIGGIETAIIASAGLTEISVSALPRIAIVATGNELVAAGQPVAAHQIRLSNGPALSAALQRHDFPDASLHHLLDSREQLRERLAELLDQHDVLILSGGVSKGKADFVPEILAELGVEKHLHFIAQRPGKPMWFGTAPDGQLIFALPGNPVSTLTCFRRYVIPALRAAAGMPARGEATARLAMDWHFRPALTAFVPVILQPDNDGVLWAAPITTNTSGDFAALAGTDGFVQLPAEQTDFACGEAFPFFAW